MINIPSVVVLMSTYNGEKYLKEQIGSILAQKGKFKLKLMVRDDGSTDGTSKLLEEYQNEGKLRWYQGTNVGPAKSFMDLLYNCGKFDYYAFSDQDDVWDNDKIDIGISSIKNIDYPAIYYCNGILVDANLRTLNKTIYSYNPNYNFISVLCASNVIGCSMLMNESLVKFLRLHQTPNKMSMHDSFIARVCLAINGGLFYDNNPHFKYRQHGDNVVGLTLNLKDKILNRLDLINKKSNVSIDEQAKEILNLYDERISKENLCDLERVANYKTNILNTLSLAFSKKLKYHSLNYSLMIRMAILLKNR